MKITFRDRLGNEDIIFEIKWNNKILWRIIAGLLYGGFALIAASVAGSNGAIVLLTTIVVGMLGGVVLSDNI